jgi:hypothetical protein
VCQVDGAHLAAAARLTVLTSLSVQRCKWIADEALAPLSRLASFNLAGTGVSGAGLRHLAGAAPLQQLDLSGCPHVGDVGLEAACGALRSLRGLRLGDTAVTGGGLRHLAALPALLSLDLGAHFEVDDARLAACRPLHALAAGSFNISCGAAGGGAPEAFEALAHLRLGGAFPSWGLGGLFPLPALTSLHVAGIDTATDATMRHVASQASLRELSVSGGYRLMDGGLAALGPLRELARLALSACPRVEPAALRTLSAGMASLSELRLSCCPQLAPGLAHSVSLPADLGLLGRADAAAGCPAPLGAGTPRILRLALCDDGRGGAAPCHEIAAPWCSALAAPAASCPCGRWQAGGCCPPRRTRTPPPLFIDRLPAAAAAPKNSPKAGLGEAGRPANHADMRMHGHTHSSVFGIVFFIV